MWHGKWRGSASQISPRCSNAPRANGSLEMFVASLLRIEVVIPQLSHLVNEFSRWHHEGAHGLPTIIGKICPSCHLQSYPEALTRPASLSGDCPTSLIKTSDDAHCPLGQYPTHEVISNTAFGNCNPHFSKSSGLAGCGRTRWFVPPLTASGLPSTADIPHRDRYFRKVR